jgi:signal transduction histidine kinase/CheY-like chemotaxis protein/ligand-binding sensor domain-containing protein/AraC-like DNA-binding protein
MKNALILLFAVAFAKAGGLPTGGTPPWPFQHINKESGLSNSANTAVYMDSHDYVWFGSWDGLNRYDGSSIKIYKPDAFEKHSISNNVVRKFLEDKNDNLWVVTHRGINRYDRDEDQFNRYFDESEDIPFTEYNLHAVLGPDSNVWITLRGQGINRFNDVSNKFERVHVDGVEDEWLKNVLDIGSASGLLYLLGSDGNLVCSLNGKVIFTRHLGAKRVDFHQFVTITGKYYVVLSSGPGQLSLFNLTAIETNALEVKLHNAVSCVSETMNKEALWVGTELGDVYKLTIDHDGAHAADMNEYFPQFSKAQRKILTVTETSQEILWIGTDGDGIYKFLARTKPFSAIVSGNTQRGDISNSIVRSIYEDEDGTLYIGTRGGGLNIVDASRKATKVINTSHGLSNNTVLSINKDKQKNIWIGVDGEGIDMIQHRTGKIFHFPRDFENKTDIAFNYVYSICIDAFGDLWLGTSGNGVIQMKVAQTRAGTYRLERTSQISHYPSATVPVTINSNIVYSIVEETPNILWFGTRGAGIYRYNSLANKIEEHFHTGSAIQNRLVDNDVLSLHVSNDELWVGTSGGVSRLALSGRPFSNVYYTQRDGLPNNTVHGILSDKENRIWFSTNNGLVMFNPSGKSFKSFDVNDGLQNNEFTDGAFCASRLSGDLFFGGINGLDVIHPNRMDTTAYFSKLVVNEFQVHNMIVTAGDSSGILKKHVNATSEIVLAHNQNFISFHFTTLDYWNKQRTSYAYFLENFDKAWNYIGQQSVVNLTNIPPGNYILHINYANKNNQWSPLPKTINITVTPPFWKTSWAYALYIVLLVGLQVGVVLFIRQRAKVKRAVAMDKFRIQQMQELNDYKLRFFTNVAHEFRTPLTLIFGPVVSLIRKSSSLWEKNQLKTIYNNSLRLQKLIDELIQFRKIESGKEKLEIVEVDLVSFTHEVVDSFQQYAAELDVNIEFIPPGESLTGWVDSRKLEKVLINLISNAIKYNTKDGHVEITLFEKSGIAEFIIRDTGIGIAEEMKEAIFESFFSNPGQGNEPNSKSAGIGLSLTRSLVHIHKGTIEMRSRKGNGSTFIVRIPIGRDAYQEADTKTMLLSTNNLVEKISQEFGLISPSEESVYSASTPEKEYTLLVVDDNAQIIILLQSILSDKYRIVSATNGEDALRLLDEEKIDLVISDVLMTKMDGLTLCRLIKDNIQTSHIPVILLTAKAEIEDRIEGLQVGADSYIPKPFHPEHLFIRVERLIRNREQVRTRFGNIAEVELDAMSTGIGEKDDAFFLKITNCIMDHLSDPEFSADIIAEEVGMSKTSLYKKVKAITGLTPHGLIKQYRLKKAADLLRNSNMSVSAVIYETGFNSRSYFYKSFNEVYHCHPKDFGGAKAG